jgi:hypothetical protein
MNEMTLLKLRDKVYDLAHKQSTLRKDFQRIEKVKVDKSVGKLDNKVDDLHKLMSKEIDNLWVDYGILHEAIDALTKVVHSMSKTLIILADKKVKR